MHTNAPDRSICREPVDERPVAALDCTTFSYDEIFADRTRNQRLRDKFLLVTTPKVVAEAEDKGFWIPPFVRVLEVTISRALRDEASEASAGLSPADLSLAQLARDLRGQGQEAYVVTEDDSLRHFTPAGWVTGHLLETALGAEECHEVVWYVPGDPAPGWEDTQGAVA